MRICPFKHCECRLIKAEICWCLGKQTFVGETVQVLLKKIVLFVNAKHINFINLNFVNYSIGLSSVF